MSYLIVLVVVVVVIALLAQLPSSGDGIDRDGHAR